MDVVRVARETGVSAEDIRTLAEAGLELEQIFQLMSDAASALSWTTSLETSDDVTVEEQDGPVETMVAGHGRPVCGWAITKHDGSAFGIRCARLNLRTDWCWDQEKVVSQAVQHSVSTTAYGNAAGWRVEPSVEGSPGWVSPPEWYRTEVKANWKLVFPPSSTQVQSGTAFARHVISARGRVRKEQGGWPH